MIATQLTSNATATPSRPADKFFRLDLTRMRGSLLRRDWALMRKISIAKDFSTWLKANRERFPVRIVALPARERIDRREYRFQGVPSLRISVGEGAFIVEVMHLRRLIDEFLVVDVPESRRSKAGRHYCVYCKSLGKAECFKDRLALLTTHTFEPFLTWCLEKIREDSLLVVQEKSGEWTAARIFSPMELKAHWKLLHRGFTIERLIGGAGAQSARGRRARVPAIRQLEGRRGERAAHRVRRRT